VLSGERRAIKPATHERHSGRLVVAGVGGVLGVDLWLMAKLIGVFNCHWHGEIAPVGRQPTAGERLRIAILIVVVEADERIGCS
jgi:hypothetical protein